MDGRGGDAERYGGSSHHQPGPVREQPGERGGGEEGTDEVLVAFAADCGRAEPTALVTGTARCARRSAVWDRARVPVNRRTMMTLARASMTESRSKHVPPVVRTI
jgi:hypothetical protein